MKNVNIKFKVIYCPTNSSVNTAKYKGVIKHLVNIVKEQEILLYEK